MKSQNRTIKQKRAYSKPKIDIIKIDNQITTFMMSEPLPPDIQGMNTNSSVDSNPFKITTQG